MAEKDGSKKSSILSKEITFGKSTKPSRYPTKTTINLVRDDTDKKRGRSVVQIVLIVAVFALFAKFAVYDQIQRLIAAQQEYGTLQEQLVTVQAANAEYDTVREEYNDVTDYYMTDEEKMTVDKMDVLAMIEEDVMPYVSVMQIQVSGSTVTITTGETTLDTVSEFLQKLQDDVRNSSATVTTTSAENSDQSEDVTASVVVNYTGGTESTEQESETMDAETRQALMEAAGLTESDLAAAGTSAGTS